MKRRFFLRMMSAGALALAIPFAVVTPRVMANPRPIEINDGGYASWLAESCLEFKTMRLNQRGALR